MTKMIGGGRQEVREEGPFGRSCLSEIEKEKDALCKPASPTPVVWRYDSQRKRKRREMRLGTETGRACAKDTERERACARERARGKKKKKNVIGKEKARAI